MNFIKNNAINFGSNFIKNNAVNFGSNFIKNNAVNFGSRIINNYLTGNLQGINAVNEDFFLSFI